MDEYRRGAGVQQQTGGRRKDRELRTGNDEVGGIEKKKKYRTVVYIYSDLQICHSDTSDQNQIEEIRVIPKTTQPMQSLVNINDKLKLTGKRKITQNFLNTLRRERIALESVEDGLL